MRRLRVRKSRRRMPMRERKRGRVFSLLLADEERGMSGANADGHRSSGNPWTPYKRLRGGFISVAAWILQRATCAWCTAAKKQTAERRETARENRTGLAFSGSRGLASSIREWTIYRELSSGKFPIAIVCASRGWPEIGRRAQSWMSRVVEVWLEGKPRRSASFIALLHRDWDVLASWLILATSTVFKQSASRCYARYYASGTFSA